jgi:hypothetical protein
LNTEGAAFVRYAGCTTELHGNHVGPILRQNRGQESFRNALINLTDDPGVREALGFLMPT